MFKEKKMYRLMLNLFIIILMVVGYCSPLISQDGITKYFVGIELNGVLCGYSEVMINNNSENNHTEINQHTYMSFKALGNDLTQKQEFNYLIDQESGNFIYHDSYMELGTNKLSASMTLKDDTIYIISTSGEENENVFIPENAILPNTMYYPYLAEDFGREGAESRIYQVFNVRNGKVQDFKYTKVGFEELELDNKNYHAVIVRESDPYTGIKNTYWIDTESGLRIKMETQINNYRSYLTDFSVTGKVRQGSWDDVIFMKTNEYIKDIRGITSMSVKTSLQAIPGPSVHDLNVNGQVFVGEIKENTINGVFRINHKKYNGEYAPSIEYYRDVDEKITAYMLPEEIIESDDPGIAELALSITDGEKNAWKAVSKLAEWIVLNIDGSIYGGSAKETLKRGSGACGSQSMLMAALCRASGIPARVVWGCMYTHVDGGSFGHHGWNEVFMGKAGWIPVDVTSHEADYVDSGHIRLGVLKTKITVINFSEMEILDYLTR